MRMKIELSKLTMSNVHRFSALVYKYSKCYLFSDDFLKTQTVIRLKSQLIGCQYGILFIINIITLKL